MNYQDALFYAKAHLTKYLENKNVIFILTTHIPEFADYLISLIKEQKPIGYYYFQINYNNFSKKYTPTFKLIEDPFENDPNNWYLRDPKMRRSYNVDRQKK